MDCGCNFRSCGSPDVRELSRVKGDGLWCTTIDGKVQAIAIAQSKWLGAGRNNLPTIGTERPASIRRCVQRCAKVKLLTWSRTEIDSSRRIKRRIQSGDCL